MKRIYLALAFIGALFTTQQASAQDMDFAADIALPLDGANLVPHGTLDTSQALLGWGCFGPDLLLTGDKILWQWSFNREADPDSLGNRRWWRWISTMSQDQTEPSFISVMPNSFMSPPESHAEAFKLAIDSIGILMDWDQWSNNDSVVYVSPPYVDNKEYGFFIRVYGLYDDVGGTFLNTDPDSSNNRAVVRVIWNGSSTSVKDLFAPKAKESLSVFPNPCVDNINFEYSFEKYTDAKVRVTDISGKVVLTKNLGRQSAGTKKSFSIDVSSLSLGLYNIELMTDEKTAISKFSVKR